MGRINPKLAPFIKLHLELGDFKNLKWEDENKGIFNIELPRFEKEKCREYEEILKAWYEFNGKSHKYIGYSNGKSVFQAALKKSVYLIALPSIGKRLRFKLATSDQVEENKRLLREKGKNDLQPTSPSTPSVASSGYQNDVQLTSPTPSVASSGYLSDVQPTSPLTPSVASSGYQSDVQPTSPDSPVTSGYQSDSEMESLQITEGQDVFWNDGNQFSEMQNGVLHDIWNNPEKYISLGDGLDDLFSDLNVDVKEQMPFQNIQLDAFKSSEELSQFMTPVTELKPPPDELLQFMRPETELKPIPEELPQFMRPVTELKLTPVGVPGTSVKKFWLCTQKIIVKNSLMLICELKVIENESSGLKEGSVVIPNEVFEPGISYELKKSFELDNIQYYFFSPNSV